MAAIFSETLKTTCGIIATLIGIASFYPYLRDVFRHKTEPHTYTWLIWTILQVTGVLAMYHSGAGIGVMTLTAGAFFCAYIFILSLKYGTKNITVFDTICLIGALAAIGVYVFMHNATLSVILITIIDFVGFLPTMRKAYAEPYSETLAMYALFTVSSAFNMVAISIYSITTTLYPGSIMFTNALCCIILWARRK
jgi:hypothetical protein